MQAQLHPRFTPGQAYVTMFDPKYINQVNGEANTAYISPASTPGQFGQLLWLHDPSNFDTDLSLTKIVPIKGDISLKLQGVFLNAFNHVAWTGLDTGVQDPTFGTTTGASSPRQIEIRGNVQF